MTKQEKIEVLRTLVRDPFAGRSLTDLEKEAATLIAQGRSIAWIADYFGVTTQAIYVRLGSFTNKTGIKHKDIPALIMRQISEILEIEEV